MHARFAALCFVLAVGQVASHPYLFVARHAQGCADQPQKAYGLHQDPKPDPEIKFQLQGANGSAVTRVCPGVAYTVKVDFPGRREALLTATVGSLNGGKGDVNGQCGGRLSSPTAAQEAGGAANLSAQLLVPCNATRANTTLSVTSATGPASAYLQADLTVPIAPSCPSSPCTGAGNLTAGGGGGLNATGPVLNATMGMGDDGNVTDAEGPVLNATLSDDDDTNATLSALPPRSSAAASTRQAAAAVASAAAAAAAVLWWG